MNNKLITEATEKGFRPELVTNLNNDKWFYLWLCELQQWLMQNHKIYVLPLPTETCAWTFKIIDIQCDPNTKIERPPFKDVHAMDYSTNQVSLEAGISEVLNQQQNV